MNRRIEFVVFRLVYPYICGDWLSYCTHLNRWVSSHLQCKTAMKKKSKNKNTNYTKRQCGTIQSAKSTANYFGRAKHCVYFIAANWMQMYESVWGFSGRKAAEIDNRENLVRCEGSPLCQLKLIWMLYIYLTEFGYSFLIRSFHPLIYTTTWNRIGGHQTANLHISSALDWRKRARKINHWFVSQWNT